MNVTDDYNDTSTTNSADLANNTLTSICTIDEKNFDIIIPTLLLTIPCGLSFLCLLNLMVYTLFKRLINK